MSNSGLKIQRAVLSDAARIFEIDDFIVAETSDIEILKYWIEHKQVFMLLENRVLVGYIAMSVTDYSGWIFSIFVSADVRGKSYGRLLLEHAIEYLKKCGVSNIGLLVRRSNDIAISLYEKYGFEKRDVRESIYDDGEDGLRYFKQIA